MTTPPDWAMPCTDEQIEAAVREDFMVWGVYQGYTNEVKEREWERMRRIEVDAFKRRLSLLFRALSALPSGRSE